MSIPQRAAIVVFRLARASLLLPGRGRRQQCRSRPARDVPAGHVPRSCRAVRAGRGAVQSFVSDGSDLERFDAGSWSLADPAPQPGDLPGPGTGTWRLNQDSCTPSLPLGGLACYAAAGSEGTGASVVYGRVARSPGVPSLLEYWYFYYDDVYSYTYPASDFDWQAHEGDWKNARRRLSPRRPSAPVRRLQPALPGAEARLERRLRLPSEPTRSCM